MPASTLYQTKDKKDPALWQPVTDTRTITSKMLGGKADSTGAFDYNTMSYPADVGSPRYPFFFMIYVNAVSKSKLLTTGQAKTVNVDLTGRKVGNNAFSTSTVGQTTNNLIGGAGTGAGELVGSIGSSLGGAISNVMPNAGDAVKRSFEYVGNAIQDTAKSAGQSVGNGITDNALLFQGAHKRLKTAVALPFPNDLQFGSNFNYTEGGVSGLLGSLLNAAANGDNMGKNMLGAVSEAAIQTAIPAIGNTLGSLLTSNVNKGAMGEASRALGGKVESLVSDPNLSGILQKMRGFAANDRREQLFNNVGMREFQFSWVFVPRSEEESKTVEDIIKFLRYHSHPELSSASGGMNFIVPNEFDIEFHHFDKGEVTSIPKITTCVLKNVQVNYTSIGKWVAFDGTTNPVAVQLHLQFAELEPLIREAVDKGY